ESIVEYSEIGRSYTYNIIKEGQYLPTTYLKYTQWQNGFRIPDNYELEILQQIRDTKRRATVLKPFDNLTSTEQNNRAKKVAKSVYEIFDQIATKNCHPKDKPNLTSIGFDIKDQSFYFNIDEKNVEDTKNKTRAVVQACDKGQVT
ncbi:6820_t:CDS:2, partial [Racocetra persica]